MDAGKTARRVDPPGRKRKPVVPVVVIVRVVVVVVLMVVAIVIMVMMVVTMVMVMVVVPLPGRFAVDRVLPAAADRAHHSTSSSRTLSSSPDVICT